MFSQSSVQSLPLEVGKISERWPQEVAKMADPSYRDTLNQLSGINQHHNNVFAGMESAAHTLGLGAVLASADAPSAGAEHLERQLIESLMNSMNHQPPPSQPSVHMLNYKQPREHYQQQCAPQFAMSSNMNGQQQQHESVQPHLNHQQPLHYQQQRQHHVQQSRQSQQQQIQQIQLHQQQQQQQRKKQEIQYDLHLTSQPLQHVQPIASAAAATQFQQRQEPSNQFSYLPAQSSAHRLTMPSNSIQHVMYSSAPAAPSTSISNNMRQDQHVSRCVCFGGRKTAVVRPRKTLKRQQDFFD